MKRLLAFFTVSVALAQNPAPPGPSPGTSPEKHETQEGPSAFEAEFVASSVFRSGSYIQPLWRGLGLEAHYFGGEETDVGYTGAAWAFRAKGVKLSPGSGVTFGSNQFATAPTVTFRWAYERAWFVTEGLILQGLRQSPVYAEGAEEHHGVRPGLSPTCGRPFVQARPSGAVGFSSTPESQLDIQPGLPRT